MCRVLSLEFIHKSPFLWQVIIIDYFMVGECKQFFS